MPPSMRPHKTELPQADTFVDAWQEALPNDLPTTDNSYNALPQETIDVFNKITAGSLPVESNAVHPRENVKIERAKVEDLFVVKKPRTVAGVEEEPTMESAMDIEVSKRKADPLSDLKMGLEALQAGQMEGAIAYYKKVLQVEPKNTNALFGLGTAYQKSQQYDQARECYLKVLKTDQRHLGALNNFMLLAAEENPPEAIKYLEMIQKYNSEFAPVPAQIAMAYLKMNRYDQAAQNMGRAAVLDPDNMQYRYYLALLMEKLGVNDIATKLYEQMLQRNRADGTPLPDDVREIRERLSMLAMEARPAN